MRRRTAAASLLVALALVPGSTTLRGGRAPEIRAEAWLNTVPLDPGDLQGKVVLVDFWTFG